jgi:cation diffusion facilitator CzcD-associated flavoprotein CzcO
VAGAIGRAPWARGLVWHESPPAQDLQKFVVAVIGAGMGGLNAAVQKKRHSVVLTAMTTIAFEAVTVSRTWSRDPRLWLS